MPEAAQFGPTTQTLRYSGEPRTIAKLDIDSLVRQAQQAQGRDRDWRAPSATPWSRTRFCCEVHGGGTRLSEKELMRAITLARERTFEQDPKYPIRLLVDVAIKALSPAINDPTTAVQTIDQIEDLLLSPGQDANWMPAMPGMRRASSPRLPDADVGGLSDPGLRRDPPVRRDFGPGHAAIAVGARWPARIRCRAPERVDAVRRYLDHLDLGVEHSPFDAEDRATARQEDRQGLGLSRGRAERGTPPS